MVIPTPMLERKLCIFYELVVTSGGKIQKRPAYLVPLKATNVLVYEQQQQHQRTVREILNDWLDVTFRFYNPPDTLYAHALLFPKAVSLCREIRPNETRVYVFNLVL